MSTDSPDELFREALALHREARHAEARTLYERVLQRQPRHVPALTFLSIIALESNDPERALALTAAALGVEPTNAGAHLLQGHAYRRVERRPEALASYQRAVASKPDLAEAHFQLGNVQSDLGRHEEAVDSYGRALSITPGAAEIHNNRGNSLRSLGRFAEAAASYARAIAAAPTMAEPRFNAGLALYELGRFDAAIASFDEAIAIRPEYPQAHFSRGNALKRLDRLQAALESYDRAIQLDPGYALAYSNRGNVQSELQRSGDALASYDAAIALAPGHADAHCNRGNLLGDLMRFDEALRSFDRAIAANPEYAQAYYSRSLVKLLLGDWNSGRRDFEWRWRNEHCASSRERRGFSRPQWLGEQPIDGKTVLLHSEQGLGDTLQFCRYATVVADRGARVVLEAPRALTPLLGSLPGVAQLVARGEPLPPFDYHCPLLSLPLAFGTTPDTIPAPIPYLRSGADRAQYWKAKLGERSKPRVGLVWSEGF